MVFSVASRISSNHWASRGYRNGNWNRIDLGWSGSHVVVVVECEGGCSRGMCTVALTPLWSRNA